MRLLAYTALFRDLARRHVVLQATPENGRFQEIFISVDPVQKQLDLSTFYGSLRSNLKVAGGESFLVLENYQVDYQDNGGDYFSRRYDGAFLVLQRVKVGDLAARTAAVDACEEIGEQLLAAAVAQLRENHRAVVSNGDAWAEHVGPIADSFVGVRLNLAWTAPATQALTFNPSKFTA